jgi:hypothetical protein
MAALLVVAGILALAAVSTTSVFRGKKSTGAGAEAKAIELPRGGTEILPHYRVVAYYGAPGGSRLGVLGSGPLTSVVNQLADQAQDYDSTERPVMPALQLISTVVHDFPGSDGMYRSRLDDATIERYLEAARQANAILILDIQPGRATFMDEVRHYQHWLEMPDVSLAIDPEWSMGPGQIPNHVVGHTDAATINEVSAYLDEIVQTNHLPQKLFIVHQFTDTMVRNERGIVQRPGLATVLNVDGFGRQDGKVAKYTELTADPERPAFIFSGFKLFFEEDTRVPGGGHDPRRLMSPYDVLALDPKPDVVVYE